MRPLASADLDRPWRLDFHQPRGVVPLGLTVIDDITAGSRTAAAAIGVDGGLVARLVGCHVYLGPAADGIPGGEAGPPGGGTSGIPAAGFGVNPLVPGGDPAAYAVRFRALWSELSAELHDQLAALDALPLADLDAGGLLDAWRQARAVCSRAWRLHFAVMYPVFAVHEWVLAGMAAEGISALEASALIEVPDHTIARTDRALADLAAFAATEGLESIFLHSPSGQLLHRLQAEPRAQRWLERFAEFDTAYGQRSAAVGDLDSPSWHESPSIPLGLVRAALVAGPSTARPARPPVPLRDRFDAAAAARVQDWLDIAAQAPAAWWNEEHNVLIDLRAHLPLRAVALAAGRHLGLPAAEDALYLHESELLGLLAGDVPSAAVGALIEQRRAVVESWRERRHDLPGHLGAPGDGGDIVLRQILGTPDARPSPDGQVDAIGPRPDHPAWSRRPRLPELEGMGVSPGLARGRARVLASADDIDQLERGEVLVCEATSPSWTPAFDRVAAAVCDAGGMLTHAAIVSREYGPPCVCAVLDATALIRTGDLLLVDGDLGVVRVLERASAVDEDSGGMP